MSLFEVGGKANFVREASLQNHDWRSAHLMPAGVASLYPYAMVRSRFPGAALALVVPIKFLARRCRLSP